MTNFHYLNLNLQDSAAAAVSFLADFISYQILKRKGIQVNPDTDLAPVSYRYAVTSLSYLVSSVEWMRGRNGLVIPEFNDVNDLLDSMNLDHRAKLALLQCRRPAVYDRSSLAPLSSFLASAARLARENYITLLLRKDTALPSTSDRRNLG